MTDLDLPQISFSRYLELLKRRWWQVIPVTVFGLIAGAIAAFLIPRYYVAETKFVFQGGAALDPGAEDPMYAVVTNAQHSLPAKTEDVLPTLGWPEASDEDEERRRGFIEGVRDRIMVAPLGDTAKTPNKVTILVTYKDTNGERAAEFANAVRDAWVDGERSRIEGVAFDEVESANRRVRAARTAKENAQTVLKNHRELHRIDPADRWDPKVPRQNPRAEELLLLRTKRTNAQAAIASLEASIEAQEVELRNEVIPEKITPPTPQIPIDPARQAAFDKLQLAYQTAQRKLRTLRTDNPRYAAAEREFKRLEARYQEEVASRVTAAVQQIENPAYQAAQRVLTQWRSEVKGYQQEIRVIDERISKVEKRVDELPRIMSKDTELVDLVAERSEELKAEQEVQRDKQQKFQALRNQRSFRVLKQAVVPPRPTDPNIVLVAFGGSLIGLATAIGLILLLDFLQTSFKTLEDVERALPVPVLGALAHLETFEERSRSVSQRRRVSLAAGVFLFLSLSVVTIYFVDPTKLPPVVMNVLDVILGTPE